MSLSIRLIRAVFTFGVIFASYMVQLVLVKVFRRWRPNPVTNREEPVMPAWLIRRQKRVDETNAKRLLAGMLKLRGVYIKLGQVLSIMGGFLPAVYTKELESLQDAVPPHPFREIERVFIESLEAGPEAFFESIDREPVAAASLGQVHVAYMPDGRKVAVKVLYPGIRDIVRTDLRVVALMIRIYKWFFPVQNIEVIHESLVDLLRRETDYIHEAECMRRMSANFADDDHMLFPEVIDEVTTRDVLTMTFMEGIEAMGFVAEGGDRRLLEQTVKTYFKKLLKLEAHTPAALMSANAKELEALADPEVERRELRTLMRSVHYPEGWFYVERASVMMFWLAGQIAPDLDQVQVGFPHVLPLLSERLRSSRPRTPDPGARPVARGG